LTASARCGQTAAGRGSNAVPCGVFHHGDDPEISPHGLLALAAALGSSSRS
jgi:hypothetical protein